MKSTLLILLLLIAGFSQGQISLKKDMPIKGGIILSHWYSVEINQDYLHQKTTVMLVPFYNKAARVATLENGLREYTKIVIVDSCGMTKAQLKAKIQKPVWVKNPAPAKDSTQTNFFYSAIDE